MAMFKKRDPKEGLQQERAALVSEEAKVAELQRDRASKLIESDGFDAIWALDRALAEQHSRIAVHKARAAAFEREHVVDEWKRAEAARVEAIEKVLAPAVVRCEALAKEVDAALASFSKAWSDLDEAARAVAANWPAAVPRPPSWAHLSVGDGQQRILEALQTDKERVSSLARRTGSVAEPVQRAGAAFLERIRGMKIPEPEGGPAEKGRVAP